VIKPQLGVPVSTITCLQKERLAVPAYVAVVAVSDLCTIAFYFLLRVGKYTSASAAKKRRTCQFRVRDVVFWRVKYIIPNTAPLHQLLQADGVHLKINNQKNGFRGSVLFHNAIDNMLCPVKALARRVRDALSVNGDT
jgi:hypothetical protein